MVDQIGIMVSAVVVAVIVMIVFAGAIGRFVERHLPVKMRRVAQGQVIHPALAASGKSSQG
jgi:predicted tellurium resistance membrane protein TerC